ncbi:LysR substrate-binding domain-containing protein [Pseudomonas paraeruginosa]|uniref:LysR substrate-binding domain-containing protein n=1 Tax=Pseudomonas paraeruginosa TaxID=2994495 RepID=UPI0039FC464E
MSIPRLPPLNAVRAFEAAARLGSYVAASKALHVTQPAVGRHVRLLEDWLGARLFERTSRGVRLTPAGRQYYAAVSAALQQIAEAGGQLGGARWLRIMAVPAFARRWLTPRLETLCAQRPGLKIALEPNPTFDHVEERSADLGIVYGLPGQYANPRALLIRPKVFPVCSPAYLAAAGPLETVERLVEHKLIHVDDGEWWNLWFSAVGVDVRVSPAVLYLSNDHALARAEEGLGIALANEVLVRQELRSGALVRPLAAEAALESYQVLTPPGVPSSDVEWFIDWLGEALREAFPDAVTC